MSSLMENPHMAYIVGGGAVVITSLILYRRLCAKPKVEWPRDKVIFHSFGRGPWAPSLSPYPVKLETYFRMQKIPYESDSKSGMSKKGKMPWISYNGEDVDDSHFCIQFLNEKFGVDPNSHLTTEEKATGRAIQTLVEDNLYWVLVCNRWRYMEASVAKKLVGPILPWYLPMGIASKSMMQYAYGHGMSRHTPEEVQYFGRLNLKTIKTLLGDKKFLFGDKACEYDCCVFGMLCQILWQLPGSPLLSYMKEKCPNLVAYCERMKVTFWPDWDECITHGYTKPASK